MRKVIILVTLGALILLSVYYLFFYEDCKTRQQLVEARARSLVGKPEWDRGYDKNVYRYFKKGIEHGVISFENRDTVRYWFISHHAVEGKGGTLFELPNGDVEFIAGYFCCEVQLPNGGDYPSAQAFWKDMKELDGISP